jgi:hypothetical protein
MHIKYDSECIVKLRFYIWISSMSGITSFLRNQIDVLVSKLNVLFILLLSNVVLFFGCISKFGVNTFSGIWVVCCGGYIQQKSIVILSRCWIFLIYFECHCNFFKRQSILYFLFSKKWDTPLFFTVPETKSELLFCRRKLTL